MADFADIVCGDEFSWRLLWEKPTQNGKKKVETSGRSLKPTKVCQATGPTF
jgi:hypothetical protein